MVTEDILKLIKKHDTDIPYGLKWRPSLEPEISDDVDWINPSRGNWTRHWSPENNDALLEAWSLLEQPPRLIVEIGVHRPEQSDNGNSSTKTLLSLKPDDCMYIGIDLDDRSFLNNIGKNIFTIRNSSSNYEEVYKLMEWYGQTEIDFMFVDGWHSVNQCIRDWKYWEKMSDKALMAFHDTNYHPGPVALLDAVDESIFDIKLFNRNEDDAGVAYVKRKGLYV
jgi:hypothetical protein